MLLVMSAMINRMNTPDATGESTYPKPKAFIFSEPMLAMSAVAPPGGCIVLVTCIATMDRETANAEDNQSSCGRSLYTSTPITAEMRCPPMRFRG